MQDQGTGSSAPGVCRGAVEQALLQLLLADRAPVVWWRSDLEAELGDRRVDLADALGDLRRAGLVHVQGDLVIASNAARRADALLG